MRDACINQLKKLVVCLLLIIQNVRRYIEDLHHYDFLSVHFIRRNLHLYVVIPLAHKLRIGHAIAYPKLCIKFVYLLLLHFIVLE